jgi:hypothetical protein
MSFTQNVLGRVYPLLGNDSVNTKARDNRTSAARQRHCKHVSSTVQALFSAWFVQSGYKKCSAV